MKNKKKNWFSYGFLTFFLIMFFNMLFSTYLVLQGLENLRQVVKVLWTFKVPWKFAYHGTVIAQ